MASKISDAMILDVIQEKWLLIGHRGAGKSSFLQGLSSQFEVCIDLDSEIEIRSQKSIPDLFLKLSEDGFRQVESATLGALLKELESKKSVVIALGAGFRAHIWPRDYRCMWLRRESDIWPRYFKDRPQIGTSEPNNFLKAYIEREQRYQEWSDLAWTLSEGSEVVSTPDTKWPLVLNGLERACLTLVPRFHGDPLDAITLRTGWWENAPEETRLRFELKSDLWTAEQIQNVLANSGASFILSVRTHKFPVADVLTQENSKVMLDWDFSFGEIPDGINPDIISMHDFSKGLDAGLKSLENLSKRYPQALLKAAPFIKTFSELKQLWDWFQKCPEKNMVFPRTLSTVENQKWSWFRLLLKDKQKVNFIREATEGPRDQPTVNEYASHIVGKNFAAVLGSPVFHSYSPAIHADFFKSKKMPFLKIPIEREEMSKEVLLFLEELGARAFAVTSPLKECAALISNSDFSDASAERVANTYVKCKETSLQWKRMNTDLVAIRELFSESTQSWRIWGAGAVAKQIFDIIPNAELYSSRTGALVSQKGLTHAAAFSLLWAAGDEAEFPPQLWKPNKVYDLSYTLRSRAILYAKQNNLDYENGIEFFKIQARSQQEFWMKHWKDL
ncbi:MAG: shikimate kinase [Bdellovibrionota bacterium]